MVGRLKSSSLLLDELTKLSRFFASGSFNFLVLGVLNSSKGGTVSGVLSSSSEDSLELSFRGFLRIDFGVSVLLSATFFVCDDLIAFSLGFLGLVGSATFFSVFSFDSTSCGSFSIVFPTDFFFLLGLVTFLPTSVLPFELGLSFPTDFGSSSLF